MQQFALHINPALLHEVLETIFRQLPDTCGKAWKKLVPNKASYFRESLISGWMGIPENAATVFKDFENPHRITRTHAATHQGTAAELRVHINNYGIFGLWVPANLEDLVLKSIDATQFHLEEIPVSPFQTGFTDLEGLTGFEAICAYLDAFYSSEIYTIEGQEYSSIINLSDEKCIAINNRNSVFLIYNQSGLVKLIHKSPYPFVQDFLSGRLAWIFP